MAYRVTRVDGTAWPGGVGLPGSTQCAAVLGALAKAIPADFIGADYSGGAFSLYSASASDKHSIAIVYTVGGPLGTMAFTWAVDGGTPTSAGSSGDPLTWVTAGGLTYWPFVVPGTGFTVKFPAKNVDGTARVYLAGEGDGYTFSSSSTSFAVGLDVLDSMPVGEKVLINVGDVPHAWQLGIVAASSTLVLPSDYSGSPLAATARAAFPVVDYTGTTPDAATYYLVQSAAGGNAWFSTSPTGAPLFEGSSMSTLGAATVGARAIVEVSSGLWRVLTV